MPSSHATPAPKDGLTGALRVLVVEEPFESRALSAELLRMRPSWRIASAIGRVDALEQLAERPADVIIVGEPSSSAELTREILLRYPWIVRVVLGAPAPLPAAPKGWSERLLAKPFDAARVRDEVEAAVTERDRHRASLRRDERAESDRPVVLIVEDRPEDTKLMRQAFAEIDAGIRLHYAPHGAGALGFLESPGRGGKDPAAHVILLDLDMPLMNGYDFLTRYRGSRGPLSPVVVVSGSTRPDERREAIRRGAASYVAKPETWDRYLDLARSLADYAWLVKST